MSLVDFAYNNNYQANIGMTPYEALYGRKCKILICWDEVGERKLNDVELIKVTSKHIQIIRERLKKAQDQQKSYADTQMRELKFKVGELVFLKVAHWKGVIRFQKRSKLNLQYISSFRILERIGSIAYRLELSQDLKRIHNVFHVSMLKKYILDQSHVLEAPLVELKEDLLFSVQLVRIIDQRMKELRNKVILMVKVLWRSDTVEEMM